MFLIWIALIILKQLAAILNMKTITNGKLQAYCSQNQSYYSEWSVTDTFYIGNFVAEAFTPEINISLSSLICEELSDINFITEQGFK